MSNDLGIDRSGNGNNWTVNNITYADQVVDSPTNNFCTLNPIYWNPVSSNIGTYSEGNLKQGGVFGCMSEGTMAAASGKWYYEVLQAGDVMFGAGVPNKWGGSNPGVNDWGIGSHLDGVWYGESSSGATTHTSYTDGDLIGIAFDVDAKKIWMSKNGTWSGANPSTGNSAALFNYAGSYPLIPAMRTSNQWGSQYTIANFGQDSSFAGNKTAQGNQDGNDIGDFYYTPPTGFLALCTKNLPAVAVTPSQHFNTVLYTGNSGTNAVTGVGFQPDFTWLKVRDIADVHALFDSVRGVNKRLYAQATNAEMTGSNQLDSWGADGFTLGADGAGQVNLNTKSYVAWNWKAGTSVSGNTTGSGTAKTYTGSVNTDNKFSIIKYTGNGTANHTIPHNLGVVPEFFAIKSLEDGENWAVYHKGTHASPETMMLKLNSTSANADVDSFLNDVAPTSSVINLGVYSRVNENDETFIAYCWASVDGYSKMGSYTGNGNADGTFVYTGFRPAFVIIKPSSRGGHWMMANNKSSPSNVVDKVIFANDTAAEYTDPAADCKKDFLSNGFKIYTTDDNTNESGSTYIYIAFAETPFKYSNAR